MKRFFVPLYKYFAGHKSLMWTLAAVLSVFSVFFGLKVGYEEDITKLLPAAWLSETLKSRTKFSYNSLQGIHWQILTLRRPTPMSSWIPCL